MLNQHKFKTNKTNPWNQFKIVVTVTVVLGFLGIIFFPILASMHCLKKTLMALSKEEGIQGRKSNSIDYQPNYCLHHNVTFFFSWLHVGYQRFFCVSRYSVIWIFHFWNTWLGYQWLPRWGSGLLLQLIDCVGFAFYFILNTSFSWK